MGQKYDLGISYVTKYMEISTSKIKLSNNGTT